jgi:hypothetical protein
LALHAKVEELTAGQGERLTEAAGVRAQIAEANAKLIEVRCRWSNLLLHPVSHV